MSRRTRPNPEDGAGGTFGIDAIMIDRCYEAFVQKFYSWWKGRGISAGFCVIVSRLIQIFSLGRSL
jgi:hypothetical protein